MILSRFSVIRPIILLAPLLLCLLAIYLAENESSQAEAKGLTSGSPGSQHLAASADGGLTKGDTFLAASPADHEMLSGYGKKKKKKKYGKKKKKKKYSKKKKKKGYGK